MKTPVASIALLMLSCAGSGPKGESLPEQILVQNDNWHDVVIFVVTMSGASRRLGDVRAVNQGILEIPADIPEGSLIRLLIEPIGSDDYFITDQIVVSGFRNIFLRISPHLSSSSWTIDDAERVDD